MNKSKELEIAAMEAEKREINELTNSFLAIRKTFEDNKEGTFNETVFSFVDKISQTIAHECHDDNLFTELNLTYKAIISYCADNRNIWDFDKTKIILDALHGKYTDLNGKYYW